MTNNSVWIVNLDFGLYLQPAVSGVPKKQKNVKLGNDDITLPLMEKTQGQLYPRALS